MAASRLSFLLAAALAGCASPQTSLHRFEETLARQDSATAALSEWCSTKSIANPARIVARPVNGAPAPEPTDARVLLNVTQGDALGYRHVRLTCGDAVLSEAHNWYVRSRLTPAMNAALDKTDMPFGRAVASLHFTRQRLATQRGAAEGCPAGTVLSHRALLTAQDGSPISLVIECYTRANLVN